MNAKDQAEALIEKLRNSYTDEEISQAVISLLKTMEEEI
jgi:hypothetical protein